MKLTKEQVARNRAAIVSAASRLFRERGVAGVALADVAAAAGMTHGGFYRQFESKEALFAEASAEAFAEIADMRRKAVATDDGRRQFRRRYLSRDQVESTAICPVVTLAAEAARADDAVQAAFAKGLRDLLASSGHEVGSKAWNRDAAEMAQLIGALLMARAVRHADPKLGQALTAAALDQK